MRVLKKHAHSAPVVMDPFCGRGTTLFAARQLGLASQGIDASPVAVAIAKAKLCEVNVEKTLALASSFMATEHAARIPRTEFFRYAFHQDVLAEICAIRQGLASLRRQTNASVLLRAAMLGCLHGPVSKNPQHQAYFSNQMPRTFASKPDYSVQYWQRNGLNPRRVDVLAALKRKLERIQEIALPAAGSIADVRLGDSRYARSIPGDSRNFSVVVTSPPYYGMRTYVQDQWLRNWFLGGPEHVEYENDEQLSHSGVAVFAESLGSVWRNMARSKTDDLHMYIRFGIIPSSKVDPRALVRASLESSRVGWKIISTRQADTAEAGKRQADQMSTNSVAATEYDFHVVRI